MHISILDNFSNGSQNALLNLPEKHNYELIESDILNPYATDKAMDGVDTIIHLAAIVRTPLSFSNPKSLQQVNLWGTTSILEKALKRNINHFIYLSTTSVYGPILEGKEQNTFNPIGAYANTKYQVEQQINSFRQRGLDISILRPATAYGIAPLTRFDALINKFIHTAGTKKAITIYGNGEQKRPFIHVKDICSAIMYSINNFNETKNNTYNLLEDNFSVNQIAQLLRAACPEMKIHFTDQDIRTHYSFEVTTDLMEDFTNWKHQFNLNNTIRDLMKQYNGFQKLNLSNYEQPMG